MALLRSQISLTFWALCIDPPFADAAGIAGATGHGELGPRYLRSRRSRITLVKDDIDDLKLEKALKSCRVCSYTLQTAIAAVHAEAESVAATDWRHIVALNDRLVRIQPSPVVQLNRAVAIAMRDRPEAGLAHIDAVLEHGELANYCLTHSARADMYRRLGRTAEARSSYEKALALTHRNQSGNSCKSGFGS